MSARTKLHEQLTAGIWTPLGGPYSPHSAAYFYWDGSTRVELHLIFDAAGRLDTWSEWRNERVSIDSGTGRRARFEERIKEVAS